MYTMASETGKYENHKYFCNVIPLHYIPLYFTLIGLFSQGGLRNVQTPKQT